LAFLLGESQSPARPATRTAAGEGAGDSHRQRVHTLRKAPTVHPVRSVPRRTCPGGSLGWACARACAEQDHAGRQACLQHAICLCVRLRLTGSGFCCCCCRALRLLAALMHACTRGLAVRVGHALAAGGFGGGGGGHRQCQGGPGEVVGGWRRHLGEHIRSEAAPTPYMHKRGLVVSTPAGSGDGRQRGSNHGAVPCRLRRQRSVAAPQPRLPAHASSLCHCCPVSGVSPDMDTEKLLISSSCPKPSSAISDSGLRPRMARCTTATACRARAQA